jgi:hypothetical protein
MAKLLVTGSILQCSMGAAPCAFVSQSLPAAPQILGALPAANVTEFTVMNIATFGMCQSEANPEVAAATAAALGVLTPMPCVPNVVAPWAPAAITSAVNGLALATEESKCTCAWGGQISVQVPTPNPESTQ